MPLRQLDSRGGQIVVNGALAFGQPGTPAKTRPLDPIPAPADYTDTYQESYQ